jgi:hypothetical protein
MKSNNDNELYGAFMTRIADEMSRLTGREVKWYTAPICEHNPYGEKGYFMARGSQAKPVLFGMGGMPTFTFRSSDAVTKLREWLETMPPNDADKSDYERGRMETIQTVLRAMKEFQL